jgi:hypothetical protein
MAWRYPQYPITPQSVLDVDPINENFLIVVGEVAGNLNEHNLDVGSLKLNRSQMADDAAFRLHRGIPTSIPVTGSDPTSIRNAGWLKIPSVGSWQTFPDPGTRLSFVAVGGTVWLNAAFNVYCRSQAYPSLDSIGYQKGFGYNFALRLDGSLLYESLLGSGDPTQDDYRHTILNPSTPGDIQTPQCGGGISAAQIPVALDAVVELLPGPHVLELAIQNLRGSMRAGPASGDTYFGTREIFALEMLR